MDGPEHRRYVRFEVSPGMPVAYRMADKSVVARATGVSLGGLFVQTQDPPANGTFLQLLFRPPTGDVRARAAVRRVEIGRGIGVEFIAMSMDDRARLNSYLKSLGG
jgi:hypothetical protein